MEKVNENSVIINPRLGENQKFVLAKLALPNATEQMKYSYTVASNDENVAAARDTLIRLGMITIGANTAQLTPKGEEALQKENLTDEMGNLTNTGEQYAYAKSIEDIEQFAAQEKPPEIPSPEQEPGQKPKPEEPKPPMGITPNEEAPVGFESWSMISSIQEELLQEEFLQKHAAKSK